MPRRDHTPANHAACHVQSIKNSLANWIASGLALDKLSFDAELIKNDNYRHHGTTILWIDYVLSGVRVSKETVCSSSDDNRWASRLARFYLGLVPLCSWPGGLAAWSTLRCSVCSAALPLFYQKLPCLSRCVHLT